MLRNSKIETSNVFDINVIVFLENVVLCFYFISISRETGSVGSVLRKIKLVLPYGNKHKTFNFELSHLRDTPLPRPLFSNRVRHQTVPAHLSNSTRLAMDTYSRSAYSSLAIIVLCAVTTFPTDIYMTCFILRVRIRIEFKYTEITNNI